MTLQSDQNYPAGRSRKAKSSTRSKIANGSKLVQGTDGRTIWAKRAKEQIFAHCQWRGGAANCSSAELSLIRRAACLEVELERMEQQFANAGEADPAELDLYARVVGNLRRTFETLAMGLEPRARDVTHDVISEAIREELDQ
jgi:hypothetical protein